MSEEAVLALGAAAVGALWLEVRTGRKELTKVTTDATVAINGVTGQVIEFRKENEAVGLKLDRLSTAVEARIRQHDGDTPKGTRVDELRLECRKGGLDEFHR